MLSYILNKKMIVIIVAVHKNDITNIYIDCAHFFINLRNLEYLDAAKKVTEIFILQIKFKNS